MDDRDSRKLKNKLKEVSKNKDMESSRQNNPKTATKSQLNRLKVSNLYFHT